MFENACWKKEDRKKENSQKKRRQAESGLKHEMGILASEADEIV